LLVGWLLVQHEGADCGDGDVEDTSLAMRREKVNLRVGNVIKGGKRGDG
jgi:hypothetical protein